MPWTLESSADSARRGRRVGIVDPPGGVWTQQGGPTVLATFARDNDHFGLDEQFMVNFRVADLAALSEQLRRSGVELLGEEHEEGVGDFAWIVDPEGNRVELWQPAEATGE